MLSRSVHQVSGYTVNLCKTATLKKDQKLVVKTNFRLMQVKSIAECSKGSILQNFGPSFIKLPFVIMIFALSIFQWPLYTGFTVAFILCLHIQENIFKTMDLHQNSALYHL